MVKAAADEMVLEGFLLKNDAERVIHDAQVSKVLAGQ
jgi:hypothetical protein